MRSAAVLVATAVLAVAPAVPAGASERMRLDCGGAIGVIERTNGASWWGVEDGTVYTTKYLYVIDDQGNEFEKHYGHVAREHVVCQAAHVVDDYASDWTVHLVVAG